MTTPINKISGIGPYTAEILVEYGYKCAEDLAATNEGSLSKVPGFGPVRANAIIESARVLCKFSSPDLEADDKTAVDKVAGDHPGKKNKSKKEKKKKKKNKNEKKSKKEKKQKKSEKEKKSTTKKKKKKDN